MPEQAEPELDRLPAVFLSQVSVKVIGFSQGRALGVVRALEPGETQLCTSSLKVDPVRARAPLLSGSEDGSGLSTYIIYIPT